MRNTCVILILLTCIAVCSVAASTAKVATYRLDVTFDPENAAMHGIAAITFDAAAGPLADTLVFYLHGELEVDSVRQASAPLTFSQEKVFYSNDYSLVANKTELALATTNPSDTVEIYYSGYFNPSRVRSPSDYMRIGADGVFLRSLGYSVWFPVFLESWKDAHPVDFTDVIIRTPSDYVTVFVGHQVGDSLDSGQRISRWQAPNTLIFDAQCASQPCSRMSVGPVNVYYRDDSVSIAMAEKIADFVTLLTTRFKELYRSDATAGEYHIVEMPRYGEISSGGMTGMPWEHWHKFDKETWAQRGLAHEIVHPFVRLPIDKNDPLYAFVVEGFPSFFHLPVLRETLGKEWYNGYLERTEERYLKYQATGQDRRGNDLPAEKPIDQITGDEIGTYRDLFILSDRAILFLNYVKVKMGKAKFVDFCDELFGQEVLTDASFREMISIYLPGSEEDIDLWLSGTDYPDRFQLGNL